jgi:hypothetical protein
VSPHEVDDVDFLLALAGFDPEKIPHKRRIDAVLVSRLWRVGVFDVDDVERTCGLAYDDVCEAQEALRIAARPGVRTG